MRGREAILVLCGLAVAGLLVFLAREATRPGDVEIDEAALARARADHQRLTAARQAQTPGDDVTESASDWSASRRPPAVAADEVDGDGQLDDGSPAARAAVGRLTRAFETRAEVEPAREDEPDALEQAMDDTNALYDKGDYQGALAAALLVLDRAPNNVRMLRVVVSSGCILGENDVAEAHYNQLTGGRDRLHMRVRCKRFGLDLPP